MTKRIWVIMLSCFCWQLLHGADTKDNEVTGLITDERLRPVEFADVALFRAADSVFVTGSVSDAKGRFSFEKFIDRLASSQAFRMTYIGVPLVAGGLLVKS